MLEILSPKPPSPSPLWLLFLLLSGALHGLLYHVVGGGGHAPARARHGSSLVSFRVEAPPTPPPAPAPAPARRTPAPAEPPARVRAPRQLRPTHTVRPPRRDSGQAARPSKPVFGVTKSSVRSGGSGSGESGAAVRLGESLATSLDREVRLPSWARGSEAPRPPAPPRPTRRDAPRPVPLYQLDTTPAFRRKVEPVYPSRARRQGIQGTVLLKVLIDSLGRVETVQVLEAPAEDLAAAAVTALRSSTLTPGLVQGRPVPVWLRIPYRFVLDG